MKLYYFVATMLLEGEKLYFNKNGVWGEFSIGETVLAPTIKALDYHYNKWNGCKIIEDQSVVVEKVNFDISFDVEPIELIEDRNNNLTMEELVNKMHEQNKQARIKTDGKFNLNKRYVFSYEKLLSDDRKGFGKSAWIETLQQFDGKNVIISSEDEGMIEGTMWSVAAVWCNEIG